MHPAQVTLLKRDALGSVELIERDGARVVRRIASGGRIPGSGLVARALLARERRALAALEGLERVPHELDDAELRACPTRDRGVPSARQVLLRSYIAGQPLHRATQLPLDFFDHLDRLVDELHDRGVCHNDLHKEQNVVVAEDGYPSLIDFQLASVHTRRTSRSFRVRCREDLRHVQKHRRRYTRDGRGPAAASAHHGAAFGARRSPLALVWRRVGKPLYTAITRGLFRSRDGEQRRPSSGPWPRWVGPLGRPPGRGRSRPARP